MDATISEISEVKHFCDILGGGEGEGCSSYSLCEFQSCNCRADRRARYDLVNIAIKVNNGRIENTDEGWLTNIWLGVRRATTSRPVFPCYQRYCFFGTWLADKHMAR